MKYNRIMIIFVLLILGLSISYSYNSVTGTTANLSIWDNYSQSALTYQSIKFNANYTNNSLLITGASCNISFNDQNASMSQSTYYLHSKMFTTPGNYSYSINCSKLNYDNLALTDWIFINANSNLNIGDNSNKLAERAQTNATFIANFTKTNGQIITGAVCSINFSDSVNKAMSQSGNSYIYSRTFDEKLNYTYNVSCSATNYNTLNKSGWIYVNDTTAPIEPIIWTTPSTINSTTISIIGYVNESDANVSVIVYQPGYAQSKPTISINSSEAGSLLSTYLTIGDRNSGDNYLTLTGADYTNLQTNKFIDIIDHGLGFYQRYNITSVTVNGAYRNVNIVPSLNQNIPASSNIKLYDKKYYNGYFNISINLFASLNNTIEIWAEDKYQNKRITPKTINILSQSNIDLTYDNFNNNITSDFSTLDIENLTNPYIGSPNIGQINFTGSNINITGYDLDSNIEISDNYVFVNSTNLVNLDINATITLFNLDYDNAPALYIINSSGRYVCPANVCSIASYNNGTLIFDVTHFSAYTTGNNSNLSIWDSVNQDGEANTTTTFYANYTNITGNSFISNATCIISFSDSATSSMTGLSNVYQYSRQFSSIANYTYNVTCNKTGYETLTAKDWIQINEQSLQAPTIWPISSPVYDEEITIIGYTGQEDVNISIYYHDATKTLNKINHTMSGAKSTLIGEYSTSYDRATGTNQLILYGSGVSGVSTSQFIEIINHSRNYYERYNITSVSFAGINSREIRISPALEQDIPAGTIVRVYNTNLPSGYFSFDLTLFSNITNIIEIWGTDSQDRTSNLTIFNVTHNSSMPELTYSGTIIDGGITTQFETLSFNWSDYTGNFTEYEIAIGTYKYPLIGYNNVMTWTSTGTDSNYTGAFDLTIDTTYYASVRIKNGPIISNIITSNGIMYFDDTAPMCIGDCIEDDGDWTNDATISGSWNFIENESSINYYEYEVGTSGCYLPNSSNVKSRTTLYPSSNADITISNPVNGQTYYFNVWATNTEIYANARSDCYNSNGIKFDNELPSGGEITYPKGKYTANTITITYKTGKDNFSGMSHAEIWQKSANIENMYTGACGSFGTSAKLKDVDLGNSTANANLIDGRCYMFELHVWDRAGNEQVYRYGGSLYNVSVDATAPSNIATVTDGGFITTGRDLSFNWSESNDYDSGLKGYYYILYNGSENGSYGSTVIDWTFTATRGVTFNNLGLKHQAHYYLEVYSSNNFGLNSTKVKSDGIVFFDNAPPAPLTIINVKDDTTVPYIIASNVTEINFSVYGEPDEECEYSKYDIDYLGLGDSRVLGSFVTNSSGYGTFSLNNSIFNEGNNEIYIVCEDMNGFEQTMDDNTRIAYIVDYSGPAIAVNEPLVNSTVTGLVDFNINITDYSGVQTANYTIINSTGGIRSPVGLYEGNNYFTLDFSGINSIEKLTLKINAVDIYAKSSTYQMNFTVDNTIPDIEDYNANNYQNDNFKVNFTFEFFANYTINITLNGSQKYYDNSSSLSQITAQNKLFDINASSNSSHWIEGNYTVKIELTNIVGYKISNATWFVIDTTPPSYSNANITPNTVYADNDAVLSIEWNDTYLSNVILQHNGNGSFANYTLNLTNGEYNYIIPSSNLTTNQTITYTWYATDLAGNAANYSANFTVQNRNPHFIIPTISFNNTKILNKEDHYGLILANDTETHNLTYGVRDVSNNITATITKIGNDTYVKISPDDNYIGSTWIVLNVSDSFGGYNESINFTLNITDSYGQTFNINTNETITISYHDNIILPTINNSLRNYSNLNSTINTAIDKSLNIALFDILIRLSDNIKILIEEINLSNYPQINMTYLPFNKSIINGSFENDNYEIIDAFLFSIDSASYTGDYTVIWNYDNYNVTDYNASHFLKIFKTDYNGTIDYNSPVMASGITADASSGIIWGEFVNFSLFILAEEKAGTEICGNLIDEDHSGADLACPPATNNNNNNPGSSSSSSSSIGNPSSSFVTSVKESCTDGKLNQDERWTDCGGVCGGILIDNKCQKIIETCNDNILNQDETGVDCGGVCNNQCVEQEEPSTIETCNDNILNQDETGVDCGGVCDGYFYNNRCNIMPLETCLDNIKNQDEQGVDCGGACINQCSNNLFAGFSFIYYLLGCIIIIGGAVGYVLVQKHNGGYDYKMPNSPADELGSIIAKENEMFTIEPEQIQPIEQSPRQKSDLDRLISYINDQQTIGVKNSIIKLNLLKNGWPQRLIEAGFEKTSCASRLHDLDKYIKASKAAGHSEEMIRSHLIKANWAEHFIDMVLHEVHILHQDFDKVRDYANTLLSKGYTKEDIIKTLIDAGWDKQDIEPYL